MTEEAESIWGMSEWYVPRAKQHLRMSEPAQITRVIMAEGVVEEFDAEGEMLRVRVLFPEMGKGGLASLWRVRHMRQEIACMKGQDNSAQLIEQKEAEFVRRKTELEREVLPGISPVQREIVIEKFLTPHDP